MSTSSGIKKVIKVLFSFLGPFRREGILEGGTLYQRV
jgi:hypothetical protein